MATRASAVILLVERVLPGSGLWIDLDRRANDPEVERIARRCPPLVGQSDLIELRSFSPCLLNAATTSRETTISSAIVRAKSTFFGIRRLHKKRRNLPSTSAADPWWH